MPLGELFGAPASCSGSEGTKVLEFGGSLNPLLNSVGKDNIPSDYWLIDSGASWRWCCWLVLVGWCVWVFGLCFVLACCFLAPGEFRPLISFHLLKIPVVDRPCLVLDRQCRKKKMIDSGACCVINKQSLENFCQSELVGTGNAAFTAANGTPVLFCGRYEIVVKVRALDSTTGKVKPGVFKIPVMVGETPYNIL